MPATPEPSARARLIETARVLFTRRGLPNVGINEVLAEGRVAKRSLYQHFASKTDLALAAYEAETKARRDAIEEARMLHDDPSDRMLALFDVASDLAGRKGFRGCAFVNLAVETAAPGEALHALVRRHKKWIADLVLSDLQELRPDLSDAERCELAEQVRVLWDGGVVGTYVHGSLSPIRAARAAAERLAAHREEYGQR